MKRWQVVLLGLFAALVVAGIGALTFGYFKFYKPLLSANAYIGGAQRLESLIANKGPYGAPADGRLTGDQVGRFLAVGERVEAALGTALVRARAQQDVLMRESRNPTSRAVRAALGEIGGAYLQAKEAQFRAFNEVGFSKAEYEWVRAELYPAAGLELVQLRIREILDDPGDLEHRVGVTRRGPGGAREQNRGLADPLRARLERWLVLGYFDL